MGLELVSEARQRLHISHAEVRGTRGEDIVERQGRQRRIATGARAANGQPIRIGIATLDQEIGRGDAVVDVVDAPHPVEATHVFPPVAGAAAVVDVDDGETTTGEGIDFQLQGRCCG